jgi:hypothetical protein
MSEFYVSEIANKSLFLGTSTAILIVPAILIVGFLYFWFGLTSSKLELRDSSLDFKAVFYGKRVDINDVDLDNVKLLDYTEKQNLPSYRTNGISLFGVNWGWFKLKNGRKSLMFVTDIKKAVLIPTNLDFDIIISTKEPEKLITAIARKGA